MIGKVCTRECVGIIITAADKINESLVSKETVELRQWGNDKLKFGIKKLSNFHHEEMTKPSFQALAVCQSNTPQGEFCRYRMTKFYRMTPK